MASMTLRLPFGVVLVAAAVPILSLGRDAPQLPDVDSVLNRATNKVQSFAAKAAAMQARVAQKHAERRTKLAAQKSEYERRLRTQADKNQALSDTNVDIRKQISVIDSRNMEIRKRTRKLQTDNDVLRNALSTMQEKVKAAKLFLNNSIVATDDTMAEALKVLEPEKPKPTLSRFLRVAGGASHSEDSDEISSLLQLSSKPVVSDVEKAEDYVPLLSRSLGDLVAAANDGEEALRAHFQEAYEQADQRREELEATKTSLIETRSSMVDTQKSLLRASELLKSTRRELQQRLEGMRVFARRVARATDDALAKAASLEVIAK